MPIGHAIKSPGNSHRIERDRHGEPGHRPEARTARSDTPAPTPQPLIRPKGRRCGAPSPDIEALLQQEMDERLDDEEQARLEAEEEAQAEEERGGLARPLITATRWPRQPTLAFFGSGWL